MIGEGTLILNRRTREAGDGVNWYRVTSLSLLRQITHRLKHDCVCGQWIVLFGRIVWFKRTTKVPRYQEIMGDQARIGPRTVAGKFNEGSRPIIYYDANED